MTDNKAANFADAFLRSAQVSRADLYGTTEDAQLTLNLRHDARLPFQGFAGPGYRQGGVVFLAINPGGGGTAYHKRTREDEELLPFIEAFRASDASEASSAFKAMSANYVRQLQTWNLWRIFNPALLASGRTLDEVAYLNCFPYRTHMDRMPSTQALRVAWSRMTEPLLNELEPAILIALGKKVGGVAQKFYEGPARLYVVPRTIGDNWVCAEAAVVLAEIEAQARTIL